MVIIKMRQPITFKVSDEEKKLIEDSAKNFSLPTATFCRTEILKKIKQEAIQN